MKATIAPRIVFFGGSAIADPGRDSSIAMKTTKNIEVAEPTPVTSRRSVRILRSSIGMRCSESEDGFKPNEPGPVLEHAPRDWHPRTEPTTMPGWNRFRASMRSGPPGAP